jgi:nitrate reductase NapD
MPISSLLVRTLKERTQSVAKKINEIDGLEVTDIVEDQVVVVSDTQTAKQDKKLHEAVEAVPGVLAVTLVYHNYEDLEEETCLKV